MGKRGRRNWRRCWLDYSAIVYQYSEFSCFSLILMPYALLKQLSYWNFNMTYDIWHKHPARLRVLHILLVVTDPLPHAILPLLNGLQILMSLHTPSQTDRIQLSLRNKYKRKLCVLECGGWVWILSSSVLVAKETKIKGGNLVIALSALREIAISIPLPSSLSLLS